MGAMKNLALLSLVCLALFQPVVEAIFLGPIAVGAVIGALAVGKGFILGSLLSQKRTRRQSGSREHTTSIIRRTTTTNMMLTINTILRDRLTITPLMITITVVVRGLLLR